MLVKDLDGHNHNWLLTGNMAKGKIDNRSSFHLATRKLLSSHFPTLQLLEEVPIPLRKNEILYLDFYIPLKKICVEVHGEQHFKFVPFYHSTMLNFLKAQRRDIEKQEWCEINGLKYIGLRFDQDEDEWSKLIQR
jgi:hypothetical protein